MGELVYLLCAAASLGCGAVLLRNYLRAPTRVVFWCLFCFLGLAIGNALLFVDLVVVPQYDLGLARSAATLAALAGLLYGFVWEMSA
jgi:hypothetical protein